MNWFCAQRGCQFEADEAPDLCPVCNNPFIHVEGAIDDDGRPAEGEAAADDSHAEGAGDDDSRKWSDLTVFRLRLIARSVGLKGYSRMKKAELVAALQATEIQ